VIKKRGDILSPYFLLYRPKWEGATMFYGDLYARDVAPEARKRPKFSRLARLLTRKYLINNFNLVK